MSYFLKTPRKQAEEIKKHLYSKGFFDVSRRVEKDEDFVYLPLTEKTTVAGCSIIEREGIAQARKPKSLRAALKVTLADNIIDLIPSSFDVVGDIAILEFSEDFPIQHKKTVSEKLLQTFPNLLVCVEKSAKVSGEYRVRGITHLAGEKRSGTIHTEYGCRYHIDVARDYFSPRLSTERMRVAEKVADGERVLVLFAGVGPYAILVARKQNPSEVVAVELNPHALDVMLENITLNKVTVEAILGDAKEVTPTLGVFDRIIMPLPKDSGDFLASTLPALKDDGVVHFYTFAHNKKEAKDFLTKKVFESKAKAKVLDVVECGSYSPCINRYCVDFKLQ